MRVLHLNLLLIDASIRQSLPLSSWQLQIDSGLYPGTVMPLVHRKAK